jgi:glc operon protein GlcG
MTARDAPRRIEAARMRLYNARSAPGNPGAMGGILMRKLVLTSVALCIAALATPAIAQAPAPYGETINLEQAKKAAAAAQAEAAKNGWAMAITVVGPTGDLVYFEKMDNTQYASVVIAQHKARAAATFRRPTKVFEERIATPAGVPALTLDGVIASDGGIPIVVGGKTVGAMGCSGGTGAQDGQTCQAGVNSLK